METTNIIQQINLSDIQTSNFINHRKRFSENELMELADSIKRNGVLQAILLRPSADSGYEIIFGERRYKAAFLAGLNAIPAVVREISDEEAMEIAWVENVKRQDITPLEEADFYQKLLATGKYDIASLCTQLGKNEAYIRTRLKLNSLIIEFKELLENEVLNIGTAFELAKYTEVQQENTYNDHYKEENSMQSWRGFPTKEIITRLKNVLTCKLDSYNFDKTDCYRCSSNTNNQSLFPIEGECGSCSNLACLKIKNTRFLVDRAKAITGSNPHLQICRQHYQFNEEAVNQLETEGYTVTPTDYLPQYPIAPVQPLPEDYENTDDYNADLNEYNTEYDEYKGSIEKLNDLFAQGKLKMYACLNDKNITLKYQILEDEFDPIEEQVAQLERKDDRNKEIAVEKTIADLKKEMKEIDLTCGDFSLLEERLLYFFMLSAVDRKNFSKMGIDSEVYYLTDEHKLSIIKDMNDDTKKIIRRDFIINGFKDCFGSSVESDLYLQFVNQHIPDKQEAIQEKYHAVYLKRHQKLEEKIASIVNPSPIAVEKDQKEKVA